MAVSEGEHQTSASRGLATVALLKANFDAGHDHIAMFEPFVVDALSAVTVDGLRADDVRKLVMERHQLALPVNTVKTLLGRVVRRGQLRREAGRYLAADQPIPDQDLPARCAAVANRQRLLAEAFVEFASQRSLDIGSTDEALSTLLRFLEQHHVSLVLHDADGLEARLPRDDPSATDARSRTMAMFLSSIAVAGGDLRDILEETLEGFVLQNALLLKDISTAERKFRSLRVFFDSGLLFGALGYEGAPTQVAVNELVILLKDTGASVEVFNETIREMRRILAVYEEKVATHNGRKSLYPTDLTRYFLSSRATPSDVREASALLETNLRRAGFQIRDHPARKIESTLNEEELARRLATQPGGENVPRVVHDVDCVAAILTLRGGRTAASLDEAGAVFVSSGGRTVRSVIEWYSDEDETGVPPIIHYLLLSNLAWLKKPASASQLKLQELVALCAAALRPSRTAWARFVDHLSRLEEGGTVTSDEVSAILASSLTDNVLAEEMIDDETDAATLTEVVERVKSSYREEAEAEIAKATKHAQAQEAEAQALRAAVTDRAATIARFASRAVAIVLTSSLLAGTVLGLLSAVNKQVPSLIAFVLAIVPLAVVSLLGALSGFSVIAWRERMEERIAERVRDWLSVR